MVKRQDGGGVPVPGPPGSIFCPATNDEINTSGNMSDNDPYDDRKLSHVICFVATDLSQPL
jgi:hypothetical protein